MNKQGKRKISGGAFALGFGIVAVLVLLSYMAFFRTGQTIIGPGADTGVGCNVNPSMSVVATDALVASQNISPTSFFYRVNDVYVGTSYATPANGDRVEVIADLTGYLASKASFKVHCGPNNVPMNAFYAYSDPTVSIYSDAGTSILSDNTFLVNETAIAAGGGSKNWKVHMVGVSQKSSGKIFMVVELPSGSATNVTSSGVSFSGLTQVAVPNGVASTNTNPTRVAYELPALVNGEVRDYNLQVNTIAGKGLTGTVIVNFYAEQNFVESDGSFKEGIFNSLSTAEYQATYSNIFALA